MLDAVFDILSKADTPETNIPLGDLYNPSWLLRLALYEANRGRLDEEVFVMHPGANWHADAILPTPFEAAFRGDRLAECRLQVDAVAGHIKVGGRGGEEITLLPDPTQFCVYLANINSPLSDGTCEYPGFNPAARTVACMAETLARSKACLSAFQHLGLYVITASGSVHNSTIKNHLTQDSLAKTVQSRVEAYEGRKDYASKKEWFESYFLPTLDRLEIGLLDWEYLFIENAALMEFYGKCRDYPTGAQVIFPM